MIANGVYFLLKESFHFRYFEKYNLKNQLKGMQMYVVEKEGVGNYPIGQIVDLIIFETIRRIRFEKTNSLLKNFDNKKEFGE